MINKQILEKYITQPDYLDLSTIPELEKLVETFPYFQSAHLLYVKNLLKEHNIHYNQQLRKAAAYAGDRAMLKNLVEQNAKEPVAVKESGQAMRQVDTASEATVDSSSNKTSDKDNAKSAHEHSSSTTSYEKDREKDQSSEKQAETEYSDLSDKPFEQAKVSQNTQSGDSEESSGSISETPAFRRKRELEQLKREMDELKKEQQTIERVIREEEQSKEQRREKYAGQSRPDSIDEDSLKAGSETKKTNTRTSEVENTISNKERNTKSSQKTSKQELIDRFIEEEPSIKRTNSVFYDPTEAARKSILQSDDIATETLARIYLKQGKVLQAIKIYEKLSLKFPQKSDYFANQIQEIKKTNK